jgi:hypothetical protein
VRPLIALAFLSLLSGCNALGVAGSDVAMGAGAGYLLFGDDIEEIQTKGVDEIRAEDAAKAVRDAVPPRAKTTAHKVADHVRDNVRATSRHVKKWWFYEPEKVAVRDTPSSYCYRTNADVLCYSQPMPGWERRLIGYQGTHAAPPAPVAMQLLPTNAVNESNLPENRIANAKPVFKEIPAEVKEEPKSVIDPQNPDAAAAASENVHEPIADPMLSPQL